MKKSYKSALEWLARNDDCSWLDDEFGYVSVTCAFVVDWFDKDEKKVINDLRKMYVKIWR